MYQGGQPAGCDAGTVRIVLHVDVPREPADMIGHALDLVGQYGALIAATIPGAVVRTATSGVSPSMDRPVTGVAVDPVRRTVAVDGRRIRLAHREYELLVYLDRANGRTVSRTELLTEVWEARAGISERTVDSHVRRLRSKLGDRAGMVTTVRGVGYRLTPSGARAAESA
ncbi:winged helix-turn-helix domain-containing protein [Mycobacterium sp. NPDC050551]|uniref:winged helix-turn-helix domain-containing protein n=1 Tax=Mycobacterium sp. NPDC050551 TaxID=3155407 RepID=UPI0034467056